MALHIIDHPLVQHKLSIMRNKETSTNKFRGLLKEIAMLMGYEVTRDFPLTYKEIKTPLQKMNAPTIAKKLLNGLKSGIAMLLGHFLDFSKCQRVLDTKIAAAGTRKRCHNRARTELFAYIRAERSYIRSL